MRKEVEKSKGIKEVEDPSVQDIAHKNVKITKELHTKVKIASKLEKKKNQNRDNLNRLRKEVKAKKEPAK